MYIELIDCVNNYIKNNKDFTIAIDENGKLDNPKYGYIISITPLINIGMDTNQIIEYVFFNRCIKINGRNHKLYIGGWFDKGKLNLDISVVSKSKNDAIQIGNYCNQKAIYDLDKKEIINIKH
ncbi:hypothetical protein [Faecalimicrobium sp. JNUCC 81]